MASSPMLGKFKVSISPDLSGFNGLGSQISASLKGVPELMQKQFSSSIDAISAELKRLGSSIEIDDLDIAKTVKEELDDAGIDKEAVELGESVGESIEKGAESKTKGLGSRLGAGLKSAAGFAGKAILAGTAAAAGGLAALATASVKSYADFEQYVGGVDKLFGDTSESVQANAAIAFKTAGLSANEYMETVTGFSASLISSLGGDTKKAASLADTAIVDMSDNANTFGTDIESLQNAYSGFAKGNYTMLDNLKLGFGGTSEEMARLVNESGVLGDTMISAGELGSVGFDTIIEAIHATQESMGIAGTTMKEGSATITGSYEQVMSGWKNVVTGLAVGGEFLETAISGFAESISAFAGNVLNILPQVVSGIATMLTELLPVLMQTIADIIPALVDLLVTSLPVLVDSLVAILPVIIDSILVAVTDLLPVLIEAIILITNGLLDALPQLIVSLVEFLIDAIPQIIEGSTTLLFAIIDAIPIILPALIKGLVQVIGTIVTSMVSSVGIIIEAAVTLLFGIIDAIPEIIEELKKVFPDVIDAIVKALGESGSQIFEAGADLINGMMDGILSVDWMGPIKDLGKNVVQGFKDFFNIHSPSRLIRDEIGVHVGLGVGAGIEGSLPKVDKDLERFNKGVLNGINTDIGITAYNNGMDTANAPLSVTVNQEVSKPESMLDLALQAKTGAQLGLETAENLKGRK